ncbi:MotA/TolQ/ExbB proton channel family protein [Desulfobacter vibrioformis]|uniref:MotA/TolQ/ExbB proton channel family protein n=1 Tax=Desulfobacter vibrioformis TaxID=34031 RepID=UPI001FDFD91B|nr:MotA/TolQ/ExbB proton channel family protein [Desulfobacter vibrioformis]
MKRLSIPFGVGLILAAVVVCLVPAPKVMAADMRKSYADLEQKRRDMAAQAAKELAAARAEALENAQAIKKDKDALVSAIATLKSQNSRLRTANGGLQEKIDVLADEQAKLQTSLEESRMVNKELAGFVRTCAKDLNSLLVQSPQSAFDKDRNSFLAPVVNQERFWSMDDLRQMCDILFGEILASGQVGLGRGMVVDRQGKDREARILSIGNFTSLYVLTDDQGRESETGFLLYSDQSSRFFALSKLPSKKFADQINAYLAGQSDCVPVDISKGGALRRFTHELNLLDQVPKGGPLVWPILALLGIAVLILVERLVFFWRRQIRVEPFMAKLSPLLASGNWQACRDLMQANKRGFIPRVLLKALPVREQTRTDMENVLQEAILAEIPPIERFLSTLGMLAAIAPLMGLLGTVTGMINTFHVITYYGAGDPRMMSGGISEALVTTMLGLTVAIPIMLFHTLLSRRVETQISTMEEKSVAFVNMVFKARNGCRPREISSATDSNQN